MTEKEKFEELVNYIENLEEKCSEEYKKIKSNAYNVRLESDYAIALRDKFNKNEGKLEIVSEIKRKILELKNKKENTYAK